ncbi:hypothetical protein MSIMFI_05584 [Mycobacterium simulans]|nr:hypothetical protein MSIMFI_05584 [Mycobacterium simulans]
MRAGLINMQGGWQHGLVEGGDHFDQPRGAGRGLGMADVGFDRAQPQRTLRVAASTIGGQQRTGFDRISQGGAGAVGFHHIHLIQGDTGVGGGLSDDALLGRPIGGGQPIRRAILVDRRARDHRQHRMPMALSITEPLQHHHRRTLTPPRAISGRGERFTAPVGSQPTLAGEFDKGCRVGHDGDSAGEGQAGFAVAQGLTCQMRGHQ